MVIAIFAFLSGIAWRDYTQQAKENPIFLSIIRPEEIQRIELKSVSAQAEKVSLYNLSGSKVLNLPGDSHALNSLWLVSIQKKDGLTIGPVTVEARHGKPSEIEVADSVRKIGELPMWRFIFLKLKYK